MGRESTSGSCHTCRLRRVRCDKAKPVCDRCQRSRCICQGYEKVLRLQSHGIARGTTVDSSHFVQIGKNNSYPTNATVIDPSPEQRGRHSCESKSEPLLIHTTHFPDSASSKFQIGRSQVPGLQRQPLYLQAGPPPEPSLTPFVDNLTFSYFFDAYSWINVHSILLQDTPMRQHLTQKYDELSYDSLRALAYGIFGQDYHIETLQQSARRIYGTVLQKLRSRLETTTKSELAGLIKPIAVLGSYMITVDKDLRFTHHLALARILDHCGPGSFQDPAILPMFESCRFTIIANAIVRRKGTFLEQGQWTTTPWSLSHEAKPGASKLLDIIARIPGIIQGADDILEERSRWAACSGSMIREETPSTVPELQHRLKKVSLDLAQWRSGWELENMPTASNILNWALFRTGDDSYRPGIYNAQGPDVYGLNMGQATGLNLPFTSVSSTVREPQANITTFGLMQEAALYITAVIWVNRLRKNLYGAALGSDCISFYNDPFYTHCRCYHENPGPSRLCHIFPEPTDHVQKHLSWNVHSARISESPVRWFTGDRTEVDGADHTSTDVTEITPFRDAFINPNSHLSGRLVLPGDVRFSGQLRILSWLINHLADSRAYVLGTLAAMGLSHCVHDVRPSEGNEFIADTISRTLKRSRYEGAADLLLKSYR
ncbi:hypothetical protein F5884DRAFT_809695 [Xylogone sp. PMI_703]|nr:hypothetical protein F5884DRAFT_809695 [Xylogone sp. PMI_703]